MELLFDSTKNEIQKLFNDVDTGQEQKQKLTNIKIIKVSNISDLKRALSTYKNVLLAIVDANIPDAVDGVAHDQFIKTNYRITGQHKTIDFICSQSINTPITLISSLNRFQKIVTRYYKVNHGLIINFISKRDLAMLRRNIQYLSLIHI